MTTRPILLRATAALAALAVAVPALAPALADVKAGTDAWARGDYVAAIQEWQAPAERGDPDAQFNLAQAYRLGRGVPRDLVKAEDLYSKAAAQGHLQAADNYGLLMFDRGERTQAMPYIRAAADRGDPRAQYLLGIAHFNGDNAPLDWVRAYALMTLAQSAGLPQAAGAIAQMDQHIPLAQRQAAASLATQIAEQTEANRNSQIAASDLGARTGGAPIKAASATPAAAATPAPAPVDAPGADFARAPDAPSTSAAPKPEPKPVPAAARPATVAAASPATAAALPKAAAPKPAPAPATKPATKPAPAAATGTWRVQLGAFGVAANADAAWSRAKARPELAGHSRINVKTGAVTKLQAGGFASREAASRACAALAKAGLTCLPVQD